MHQNLRIDEYFKIVTFFWGGLSYITPKNMEMLKCTFLHRPYSHWFIKLYSNCNSIALYKSSITECIRSNPPCSSPPPSSCRWPWWRTPRGWRWSQWWSRTQIYWPDCYKFSLLQPHFFSPWLAGPAPVAQGRGEIGWEENSLTCWLVWCLCGVSLC